MEYLLSRLKERSTYEGIVVALVGVGILDGNVDPTVIEQFITFGITGIGLVRTLFADPAPVAPPKK